MSSLPILTYHRILAGEPTLAMDPHRISVSQRQFCRHLKWLKWLGYRTVRLEDYVRALGSPLTPGSARPSPPKGERDGVRGKLFAITFDDGYAEVLSLGLPILKEFGYQATVFAVASEECNRWDDGAARLMSNDELRAWKAAGMEVGAHTCHHVHLPKVPPEEARQEIVESKTRLESILGHTVATLAYPYGESTPAIETMVREAGYVGAFATDRAPREHSENPYRLRRAVVFPRNTLWEIFIKAQRWYPAYQDWKRR